MGVRDMIFGKKKSKLQNGNINPNGSEGEGFSKALSISALRGSKSVYGTDSVWTRNKNSMTIGTMSVGHGANTMRTTGSRTNLNALGKFGSTTLNKFSPQPIQNSVSTFSNQQTVSSHSGITIAGHYKLYYRIGKGSFGELYLAVDTRTQKEVAIKVETTNVTPQSLPYEYKVYKRLKGGEGIPKIHFFGIDRGRQISILAMELLGPSLEDLFKFCGQKLSTKTTLMLADQMLSKVEWIHERNLVHRDIKPDNFMMGIGKNCNRVYIADFGLAKRYRNSVGKHIKFRDDKNLTGTARYASINTHYGAEQSRRDDLESLGYVFIYFLKGKLPWQDLKTRNRSKSKYDIIAEKKLCTPVHELCHGCPVEFTMYLQYVRGLKFDEDPKYDYLRQLFSVLMQTNNYENDFNYDWTSYMNQQSNAQDRSVSSGYSSSSKETKDKENMQEKKCIFNFPIGKFLFTKSRGTPSTKAVPAINNTKVRSSMYVGSASKYKSAKGMYSKSVRSHR